MKKILAFCCLFAAFNAVTETVDFSLLDLDGRPHRLSDYRGKWVVVNYWATWCPPCLEEIPELVDFHNRHADKDAVVLGIDYEDIGVEQLRVFVKRLAVSYPILRSDDLSVMPLGMIPSLPMTIVISPDGVPVARQLGPVNKAALEAFIERESR